MTLLSNFQAFLKKQQRAENPEKAELSARRDFVFWQVSTLAFFVCLTSVPVFFLARDFAETYIIIVATLFWIAPMWDLLFFHRARRWRWVERNLLRLGGLVEPRLKPFEEVKLSCLASLVRLGPGKFVPSSIGRLTLTNQRLFYSPSHFWLPRCRAKSLRRIQIFLNEVKHGAPTYEMKCSPDKGLMGVTWFFPLPSILLETRSGRRYLLQCCAPHFFYDRLADVLVDTGYR